MKETNKGALGPPGKPIEKGLKLRVFVLASLQSESCMHSPDPWVQLEPKYYRRHGISYARPEGSRRFRLGLTATFKALII